MAYSTSMAKSFLSENFHNQPNYNINDLPDSILIQILIRVPTCKSAQQCKCVCKRWLSLISNPYFRSCFINQHGGRRGVSPPGWVSGAEPVTILHQYRYFAYHDVEPDPKVTITSHPVHTKLDAITDHSVLKARKRFELDYLPFGQTADIVASCEDLVVCYDRWVSFELLQKDLGAPFYVCNVLTKEWTALPPASSSFWNSGLVGIITYEADPSKTKVRELTCNYKVVHISNPKEFYVEVFCSETGEWSQPVVLSCTELALHEKFITNAVTLKRQLHWIINIKSILIFDPFGCDSQTRLLDLPALEGVGQNNETECLGVCEEHLCLSQLMRVNRIHMVKVWELKDYNAGEWCLKYNVCFNEMEFVRDHLIDCQLGLGDVACLLAFHPHEKNVLYLRYQNQILICNVQGRTLEVIKDCNRSWTWHLKNERDTAYPLVHPCWPSPVRPLC